MTKLTDAEARAYAVALARGTGTADLHETELRRIMVTGAEWKTHGALHALVLSGEIDLRWKQRGCGALEVMARKGE